MKAAKDLAAGLVEAGSAAEDVAADSAVAEGSVGGSAESAVAG